MITHQKLEFGNDAQIAYLRKYQREQLDKERKAKERKEHGTKKYSVSITASAYTTMEIDAVDEEEAKEIAHEEFMDELAEYLEIDHTTATELK